MIFYLDYVNIEEIIEKGKKVDRKKDVSKQWEKLLQDLDILNNLPFFIKSSVIKKYWEPRLMCYSVERNDLPKIFIENNIGILPVKNGEYVIFKNGEKDTYIDLPDWDTLDIEEIKVKNKRLSLLELGNSESQHIDLCVSHGIIDKLWNDNFDIVLRGRKRTGIIRFNIGNFPIETRGVQYEVDTGLEGRNKILLIESKNSNGKIRNVNARQFFFPLKEIKRVIGNEKEIICPFFEKIGSIYVICEIAFKDENDITTGYVRNARRIKVLKDG